LSRITREKTTKKRGQGKRPRMNGFFENESTEEEDAKRGGQALSYATSEVECSKRRRGGDHRLSRTWRRLGREELLPPLSPSGKKEGSVDHGRENTAPEREERAEYLSAVARSGEKKERVGARKRDWRRAFREWGGLEKKERSGLFHGHGNTIGGLRSFLEDRGKSRGGTIVRSQTREDGGKDERGESDILSWSLNFC